MHLLNTFVRSTFTNKNVLQATLLKSSARIFFAKRMNHIKAEDAQEFTIQLPIGQVTGIIKKFPSEKSYPAG